MQFLKNFVDTMDDIVNQSLRKIAKGAGIIFIGAIFDMALRFVGRVLIVRYVSVSEYGLYSLAFSVLSILAIISVLGLPQGSTRFIAYYRGKSEETKIRSVLSFSTVFVLTGSILLSIALFLSADLLSSSVFRSPELSLPLKIFALALPFRVLIQTFISFFRGFADVKPNVYFENILRRVLFVVLLLLVILLDLSFTGVLYAMAASLIVTFLAMGIYTIRKLPLSSIRPKFEFPAGKELFFFSVPLLGVAVLNTAMNTIDTLMLGYFKTSDVVGLYNGAFPLAALMAMILSTSSFLYSPIATELYSKGLMTELRRTFQIITKWMFYAALPVFFILFLFPEVVLGFIFGPDYIPASTALRILLLGYIFHVIVGMNGLSLMVVGETRFLMISTILVFISNVFLNLALIPPFGIAGAAFATTSSYFLRNIFYSVKLYRSYGIQPFTRNYMKPLGFTIILFAVIYAFTSYTVLDFWMLPIVLAIFLVFYVFLLLLSKSFDKEDIDMVLKIEEKTGISLGPIKKLLKRFI